MHQPIPVRATRQLHRRASGEAATTSLQSEAWGWAPKRQRRSPTLSKEIAQIPPR